MTPYVDENTNHTDAPRDYGNHTNAPRAYANNQTNAPRAYTHPRSRTQESYTPNGREIRRAHTSSGSETRENYRLDSWEAQTCSYTKRRADGQPCGKVVDPQGLKSGMCLECLEYDMCMEDTYGTGSQAAAQLADRGMQATWSGRSSGKQM